MSGLRLPIPDELLDLLADRVAERLEQRAGASPAAGWLTAAEAAEHLGCPLSRVRKLTMTGELPVQRDGRRCLYRREELDTFVRHGGARCP